MFRLIAGLLALLLVVEPASAAVVQITVKDASGTTRNMNVTTNSDITGNLDFNQVICDQAAGTTCATVTGANALKVDGSAVTQPVSLTSTTITGNVTAVQPTGTNLHAVLDTTSTTAVTQATGTNLHAVLDTTSTTAVTQATAANLNATVNMSQMGGTAINSGCVGALSGFSVAIPATVCGVFGSYVINANANLGNNVDNVAPAGACCSPVAGFAYTFDGTNFQRQFTVGNQVRVQVAQTVTASSAYASGNAVGGLMTIANAARVSGSLGASGTSGILQNVAVNSKSVQTAQMDIFVFDANPSGSTCTDKSAFVLATADFDKVIGVISVPSTVTNNNGWFSGGTGSVGQANNQAMAYDISSGTSLFACMVTRGTPTFTATTDISLKFQALRG